MQRYVHNVYRSHAQSGEGFHQAPAHQKKCNEPYLEPVREEAAWNQDQAKGFGHEGASGEIIEDLGRGNNAAIRPCLPHTRRESGSSRTVSYKRGRRSRSGAYRPTSV